MCKKSVCIYEIQRTITGSGSLLSRRVYSSSGTVIKLLMIEDDAVRNNNNQWSAKPKIFG